MKKVLLGAYILVFAALSLGTVVFDVVKRHDYVLAVGEAVTCLYLIVMMLLRLAENLSVRGLALS